MGGKGTFAPDLALLQRLSVLRFPSPGEMALEQGLEIAVLQFSGPGLICFVQAFGPQRIAAAVCVSSLMGQIMKSVGLAGAYHIPRIRVGMAHPFMAAPLVFLDRLRPFCPTLSRPLPIAVFFLLWYNTKTSPAPLRPPR